MPHRVEALGKGAGWGYLVVRENGEPSWYFDGRRGNCITLLVRDKGRTNGISCPVQHQAGEQFVLAEAVFYVSCAVAPPLEHLDQPRGQPGWGVGRALQQWRSFIATLLTAHLCLFINIQSLDFQVGGFPYLFTMQLTCLVRLCWAGHFFGHSPLAGSSNVGGFTPAFELPFPFFRQNRDRIERVLCGHT